MPFITRIQKYSIHDGDGIRTTVFFKGCPLRCRWCHNPETQAYQPVLLVHQDRCTGCGACEKVCPQKAISVTEQKATTKFDLCTTCGLCTNACVQNLREVVGRKYTVNELLKELQKDEMFYEQSEGGVTLSGGEVMTANIDYIEDLCKKLTHLGISVMIDTCGLAPYENFQRLLPYVQAFLYDIKTLDTDLHKHHTGFGNEQILSNLEKLSSQGKTIYIRIPVIKGVNGDDPSMEAIISYLLDKHIHAKKIHLLPYHNTGMAKYEKLGKHYDGGSFAAPTEEELRHFADLFIQAGFPNVKIGG